MRKASWREAIDQAEYEKTPEAIFNAERRAWEKGMATFVRDALDGRVLSIDMLALTAPESAAEAILASHESRLGTPLSDRDRDYVRDLARIGWQTRRDRLRVQLAEAQRALHSPFSVFGSRVG